MRPEPRPASRPDIVITGIGLLTSLGSGRDANFAALLRGQSGIRRITRFATAGMRTTIAGTVDHLDVADPSPPARSERMAEIVIAEALLQARLDRVDGPLFLAIPPVELDWDQRLALAAATGLAAPTYRDLLAEAATGRHAAMHERTLFGSVAERLAVRFGTRGSPVATSTACASGGTAIQLGLEAIRRGECDRCVCAGTDGSVTPEGLIRFSLLSALSSRNETPETASRPFSKDRDGFVMAEGAAALILERRDLAEARGAEILGVIAGAGEVADGFHRTRSSPDGKPIIACMRAAIADAGLTPDAIGYVNAHGTSTPENDRQEFAALQAVFGERAARLPVSSNKSMIGHTLTAAGAIEAAVTALSLRAGLFPPTINVSPDPALPIDCIPEGARRLDARAAISNSFGFGGQNVCLVITSPSPPGEARGEGRTPE